MEYVGFTVSFSLDNAEAEEMGTDMAVPAYLRQVADKAEDGQTSGTVRDGNGVTIGSFEVTRTPA
jgi:hypothetical protein